DNEYIAGCTRRFPDRLQGLACVEEWLIQSHPDAAIRKLERAVGDLGLAGLQFLSFHLGLYGVDENWEGPGFRPFWDAVARLGIPVFFTLGGFSLDQYLSELRRLRRWMERYPRGRMVLTHGLGDWRLFAEGDRLCVPEAVYQTAPIDHPNFHVQLLFAVFLQTRWDYPMPQIRPVLAEMIERIGADRLMWGTDIPIVLLHWTYRQSLEYLRQYCDFVSAADMGLLLGGNMDRFMGPEAPAGTPRGGGV
ncbi:MAG: amidohydrolase, partial [Armatimonadetes bacterium]|nr:amidohydrolase [Armatimonadota bacterium]